MHRHLAGALVVRLHYRKTFASLHLRVAMGEEGPPPLLIRSAWNAEAEAGGCAPQRVPGRDPPSSRRADGGGASERGADSGSGHP